MALKNKSYTLVIKRHEKLMSIHQGVYFTFSLDYKNYYTPELEKSGCQSSALIRDCFRIQNENGIVEERTRHTPRDRH